jgi:NitT/TauT family transport system permease protein
MLGFAKRLGPIAVFLLVWEAACALYRIPAYLLPAPHRVVQSIIEHQRLLSEHAVISFVEILAGFALASAVAFACAIIIVHSRRLELLMEPFLVVSQVIPKVALAPLFIIWFGHGITPKIIIAMLIAFFPLLVNTVLGLRSVDSEIVELMNSVAATKRQVFWHVRLPNSLPYVVSSLKVASLLAVVGAMVGEFVGSDKGLGYLMIVGDVNLDTDLLFASLVIVTLFGLILYALLEAVEKRVARRYGAAENQQMITI